MKRYPLTQAWADAIEAWTIALKAAGRTAQTIETRTEILRRFARQTGAPNPGMVTQRRVIEWAGSHEWARETRRSTYASLRGFYTFALEAGICHESPCEHLPVVKPGPAMPRPCSEQAYHAALDAADDRARVILRLAAEAGLRRAEIAQISSNDLFRDLSGMSLMVHGKGDRNRIVPLTDALAACIVNYMGSRRFLLPNDLGGHLTPRHVAKIARRCLPDGVTLHMLRHRFATRAYTATGDLMATRSLLGHASVATTQRYVAVADDTLRRTVNAIA